MVFAVLLYLLLFSGTQDRNQESHCKSHTKSIDPPYTCVRPPLGAGVPGARQGWGGEGRAGPRAQAPVSREAGSQEPIPGRWGEADCTRSEAIVPSDFTYRTQIQR